MGSPLTVPKAGELIADSLRRQIVRGELSEGETLPTEQDLMRQFNVSRPTLREAFRILESESLITVRRGARSRVHLPGTEVAARHIGLLLQLRGTPLAHVYDARMLIEPPMVGALAETRTAQDVRILRAHLDYEAEHLTDLDVFALATATFHQLLMNSSPNDALGVFASLLDDIFQRHVTQSVQRTKDEVDYEELNQRALANHTRVVDLIDARDGGEAESFWRSHMEQVRPYVLRQFGEATVVDLYI